ncbi:MAG: taurine dioxygenase [Gammaproteobacteria bacterium]|nr:taurine dioxygenase [Gammaproteobacteria bacterium]
MEIRKAAGALGAFIDGVDLTQAVDSTALFAEIHAALLTHEVLFFRDQHIAPATLRAFSARFGQIEGHPAYPVVEGTQDVQILESTAAKPSKIEAWHSDMTFRREPPAYTVLHGQIIPAYGGDTLFSSATAAYEGLSSAYRQLLDGLTATHDFRYGFKESLAEPGGFERLQDAIVANPPVSHPVVRTHPETQRKAIYVNSLFTTRIDDLTAAESRAVLDFLFDHLVTEEFTVRLNWQPATVVIWDNRSTQHKPVNDFLPQHRKHHRVTVIGDRPH